MPSAERSGGKRVKTAIGLATVLLLAAGALSPSASAPTPRYIDLDRVPKPDISGAEIMAGLEEFVDRFPARYNGTSNNVAAAEFLADEATEHGFETRILELPGPPLQPTLRVVEAVKRGTTKADEWIVFVSHYDIDGSPDTATVPGFSIQGAYDNGSGANMLRFFGKAFSKLKTKRSIVLLWFDAEENGLLASRAYAPQIKEEGQKIAAVFGFDMVGIGYPARYCMCIYHGSIPTDGPIALPIIDYVNFDHLEFPEGDGGAAATEKWPLGTEPHVCSCGPNPRNSDEQSFEAQGYFTMRWAGMRLAADYPGYHKPWDAVALMELVAGDRETLEAGTENVFVSAYYSAFVIDNLPYTAIYPPTGQ